MSVGDSARQHCPVPLEIQLQMAVGRHHALTDNVKQADQRRLQTRIRPHPIEIGVRLQDMQMRIHGLVGIDVMRGQGHVFQRREIAGERFDIAAVLRIREMRLDRLKESRRHGQDLRVSRCLIEFAEPIDGKTLGIQLLLDIKRFTCSRNTPIDTAVFRIDKMGQKPILGRNGCREVLRPAQLTIGRRERPHNAGIQDNAPRGVGQHGPVRKDFPIEASGRILQRQPIVQNILFQHIGCLPQEQVSSRFHLVHLRIPASRE